METRKNRSKARFRTMKDIPGYEGKYAVTEDGKVWSHFTNKFLKGCNDGDGYLAVTTRRDGRQFCSRIHQLVATTYLGRKPNEPVDHIDRNKHNNSVSNLRLCTNSQNQHNTVKWRTNKSGFKGVSKTPWGTFTATIKVKGKTVGLKYLGSFPTAELAAKAYDSMAIQLMGDFARTNFPMEKI